MSITVSAGKLVVDGVELPEGTVLSLILADAALADAPLADLTFTDLILADDEAEAVWALWYEECGDVLMAEECLGRFNALP